jgi:hypothetical protein
MSFQKVQLVQAVAQGFRGFKKVFTFQFDAGKNEFVADNAEGKSSLGELIAWVLTGRSVEGKQKELNIVNENVDRAVGRVVFRDEFGNIHEVERRLSSSTTIKYNLEAISQKKLEELLPADLFLSIYNPIYFLSLDKDASRKTINSLIPTIVKDDVLAEMNSYERDLLEKESFDVYDTNEYLKNRRQDVTKIDEELKYLEGYMGKLQETIIVPEARSFDEAPMKAFQTKIEELNTQKAPLKSMEDVLKQRNEIQKVLSEVQHMPFPHLQLRQELLQEKAVLQQQIVTEQAKEYAPFNPAELQTKVEVLRNDYKHVLGLTKTIEQKVMELDSKHVHVKEGESCPYCKQSISKEAVTVLADELKKEVNKEKGKLSEEKQEKAKTLAELAEEGKQLTTLIVASKKEDDQKREAFEKAKAVTIAKIQARLKEIEQHLAKVVEEEKSFEDNKKIRMANLQKEIDALGLAQLEQENRKIEAEFNAKIQAEKAPLQAELARLQQEKEEVMKHEALRQTKLAEKEKQAQDIVKYKETSERYGKEKDELEMKINLMKNFNAKKIEIVNKTVSSHLKDVSISLQKTVPTTGEIKDCFDIMYQGRDLKICSTAETIKAGLELSHMISTLANKEYPVFVDNGESITKYDSQANQVIEVRVVEGKKLSKVKDGVETVIEPTEVKKPKSSSLRSSVTA